jgi:hypothetical protein
MNRMFELCITMHKRLEFRSTNIARQGRIILRSRKHKCIIYLKSINGYIHDFTVQLKNNIQGSKIQGSSVTSSWALHNDYWAFCVFGAVITYTANQSPENK